MNSVISKKLKSALLCAAIGAWAGAGIRAQERGQEPATGEPVVEDAAAKDGPLVLPHTAVLGVVVSNGLEGSEREVLGRVRDVWIDPRTGAIGDVLLECEAPESAAEREAEPRHVRIAWDMLGWDADAGSFRSAMSPAAIAALPAIEKQTDVEAGQTDRDVAEAGSEGESRPAEGDARQPQAMRASDLVGCPLRAADADFGLVHSLWFAGDSSCALAFVAVAARGAEAPARTVLIPWQLLEVQHDDHGAPGLATARPAGAFADAPQLEAGGVDPRDQAVRQRICEFYGVPALRGDDRD